MTVGNLTSSIVQPLFGYMSDRLSRGWLAPLGCLLASLGVALAAQAPTYGLLLSAVVVSSLGVAIFHPEATHGKRAVRVASSERNGVFHRRRQLWLRAWPYSGMGALLAVYGRPGALGILLLTVTVPPALWLAMRQVTRRAASSRTGPQAPVSQAATRRGALVLLVAVIFFPRSGTMQTGLVTFIPLYFVTFLGEPPSVGNQLLSLLLFGSVVGTVLGGTLADRLGRKPVVAISLFVTAPLLVLFLQMSGVASGLALLGAGVVCYDELGNGRDGTGAPAALDRAGGRADDRVRFRIGRPRRGTFGSVADTVGIATTMAIVCLLPLPGALLSLLLPDTLERRQGVPEGVAT